MSVVPHFHTVDSGSQQKSDKVIFLIKAYFINFQRKEKEHNSLVNNSQSDDCRGSTLVFKWYSQYKELRLSGVMFWGIMSKSDFCPGDVMTEYGLWFY